MKSQIESESEKQEVTFGKLVVGEVMATRGCHPGGLGERHKIKILFKSFIQYELKHLEALN